MFETANIRPVSQFKIVPAYLLMVILLCLSEATHAEETAEIYIDKYGLTDRSDATIRRVHDVYARVKATAALSGRSAPELYIVDSPADPWAQALPDGSIILSRGAVAVCYREASAFVGDARVAFVLGHELAHHAKDDFWHSRVHRALAGEPGTESLRALLRSTSDAAPEQYAEIRAKEAQADDFGFQYAGLAGYAVDALLGDGNDRLDFFRFWVEQTHVQAATDPLHPKPEDRAALIRARLGDVIRNLEYFRFGVRLLSIERFEEARYFLEAYEDIFPAAEVLGNLGYLHLRLSMKTMPDDLAYRFWMPALFDVSSRADNLSMPGRGDEIPPESQASLDRATEYLDNAVSMDAGYFPAWVNLAIAHFYRGEMALALHAAGRAAELAPNDADLASLQAVIMARLDPAIDTWPQAIAALNRLVDDGTATPAVLYNLARLLEERDRNEDAEAYWSQLRASYSALPPPYRFEACQDQQPECKDPSGSPVPMPWALPVDVGVDLFEHPEMRGLLNSGSWEADEFDFQRRGMSGHIYRKPGEAAVLDLDGYTTMVVLYGPGSGRTEEILSNLGEPDSVQRTVGGEQWSWGGSLNVVVLDQQITEAWIAAAENE